jgi:2-methylcitrate dehydratase PrpD
MESPVTLAEHVPDSTDPLGSRAVGADTLSLQIGRWAADVRLDEVPERVREQALLHILDCVGLAYASSGFEFAKRTLAAVSENGLGEAAVIAHTARLSARDAALLNGVLIHGLDYDDTHLPGVVHASASALPLALAVAAQKRLPGSDLLLGYLIALEVSARIATAANSGFHAQGFHPTGLVGAFGCATAAARLGGLNAVGISSAQGLAGSLASGSLEFLATGASTKRMHPGWAALCGMTAADFARHGFETPPAVYEGRYGLFATHTPLGHDVDLSLAVASLGSTWELLRTAIKPYPACHFTHAFADAALLLAARSQLRAEDVDSVTCLVPPAVIPAVCEPADAKLRPRSDYDARFSLRYIVAAVLERGRFSLAELEDEALNDPVILELAARVHYEADPTSAFPKYFDGEVVIRTRDGRELRHREAMNRGSEERPLPAADIEAKFYDNMSLAASPSVAARVHEAVMTLPAERDSARFADALRA